MSSDSNTNTSVKLLESERNSNMSESHGDLSVRKVDEFDDEIGILA